MYISSTGVSQLSGIFKGFWWPVVSALTWVAGCVLDESEAA